METADKICRAHDIQAPPVQRHFGADVATAFTGRKGVPRDVRQRRSAEDQAPAARAGVLAFLYWVRLTRALISPPLPLASPAGPVALTSRTPLIPTSE